MKGLAALQQKIDDKSATIGVIGLGYVGLPVAAMFADAGYRVVGVDIKDERMAQINAGQNPIEGEEPGLAELLRHVAENGRLHATTDYSRLAKADVVLIDVETPVDEKHVPRYEALRAACRSLGAVMPRGTLVVVESTVAPGTVDGVVTPLLEEASGVAAHQEFYVGACPERVMPGRLLRNLRTMSRVCGGGTPETAETMIRLYRQIVEADLDASDPLTAELVKTTENAYRDVQIAFANEVALICEATGADVWQVRELVNKVPSRNMHLPGAGVGGHCIPKDPWLLAYGARGEAPVRLIPAARAVNESMPLHMARLTEAALAEAGVELENARVAVLGYAYLEDSDDTRNSPSAALVVALEGRGAEVIIHDPWVSPYTRDVYEAVTGADAAVIMVRHRGYLALDLARLREALRTPLVVDGRRVVERAAAEAVGLRLVGVGRPGSLGRS